MPAIPSAAPSRVAAISSAIHQVLAPVIGADTVRTEANEAFQTAATGFTSARLGALVALAELAHAGDWTPGEVTAGAAEAVRLSSNAKLPKSINTFLAEAKRAMAPKARAHVRGLHELCSTVWADEAALPKDAAKPCAKAFARLYHMVLAAIRAADEGAVLAGSAAVVAWAETHNPDHDAKKVAARIADLRTELAGMAQHWRAEAFMEADTFLAGLTESALAAARAVVIAEEAARLAAHTLAFVTQPAPKPAPSTTATPEMSGNALIDAALDGILPLAA